MSFKDMANDIVTIEKPSGEQIGGVRASVQSGKVFIFDANVLLEEDDIISRKMRNGTEEMFEVTDRGFHEGVHGIEAHYQATVRRIRERRQRVRTQQPDRRRRVFLVHGRNQAARSAVVAFLRSIDLQPIEWNEAVRLTGETAPFVGRVMEAGFASAQAVVVLLTGDDLAQLTPELLEADDAEHERVPTPQARPNVLFEAGYAFAKYPDRTVIVEFGKLRPFSDVQGRHVIRMSDSSAKRQELANRLEAAGCPVNIGGTDWHTAGDFSNLS